MKFRVDKEDLIKFCWLLLPILYISAILVLNISYLAQEGTFYGLLPFKAFTAKYIGATLAIFLITVVGVFLAVNSSVFSREKGWGITTEKKPNGYARWATAKEYKEKLVEVDIRQDKINAAGVPIISDGKHMWVDNGEDHYLVVGATGSGKTVIVAKPTIKLLAKAGESMILTDPKGELYENTGEMLKEYGYNVILLNFRDPHKGNAWNPMSLPYKLYKEGNQDKAIELLDDLALNILYEEKAGGNADPFWEKSAADYFTGLALGLFEDASEDQINLNSLNLMSSLGEERFGGPNNNYIKEYFNSKDPSKPAYINASGTVYGAEDTKQGVIATFKQKVKLFSSRENLSQMLSYSDFDMKDIGKQKTAVFMIVQDEKKTLHPLATIFIKQVYETLIDVAQECGGHLPYRTNFILDEFANMPPLKDVTTMVTAARSRHIRFNFIIQNYAQLTQVYGKENAETIKGNCNTIYLISSEIAALEEISKMCGEVKSKEKDKTASTPLVTVSDLQRLSQFEIIVIRRRMMPFKTRFKTDFEVDWGKKYPLATYPVRKQSEVKLFDIREYVKKQKQEKMKNSFGGQSMFDTSSNLFGGGTNPSMYGINPFQQQFGMSNTSQNSMIDTPSSDFDIDELVKKIDAKIAELEEEEKNNDDNDNKVIEMESQENTTPKIDDLVPRESMIDKTNENNDKESITTSINIDELSKPIAQQSNSKDEDDDVFFDDFFSDDE